MFILYISIKINSLLNWCGVGCIYVPYSSEYLLPYDFKYLKFSKTFLYSFLTYFFISLISTYIIYFYNIFINSKSWLVVKLNFRSFYIYSNIVLSIRYDNYFFDVKYNYFKSLYDSNYLLNVKDDITSYWCNNI